MNLKEVLEQKSKFRKFLYSRGFCITSKQLETEKYPFFGLWNTFCFDNYYFYIHPDKPIAFYKDNNRTYFLIGHAYNPFSMEYREEELLKEFSKNSKWEATNHWTGVYCVGYVEGERVFFTSDAAGQQLVYYGFVNGHVYITSHARLVRDFESIVQDKYIDKLTNYHYFHAFGLVLPGDLSPYKELKRAQCNFFTSMKRDGTAEFTRFWPKRRIEEKDVDNTIHEIGELMHRNMELISQKWPNSRAAISVTGGMDSKTTMACSSGLYDRFSYFSYDSLPDEKVDCDAAHELCRALGIEHQQYLIPYSDEEVEDIEIWRELLRYNCGCIGDCNRNDVRKRAFFAKRADFDIEVKSWVDEIGRARYHKRFGKRGFPQKPTARYLSSLYKPFIWQRLLLIKTDKVFSKYLEEYYSDGVFDLVPWWDLIYWEFEWGAAEGAFLTGEHLLGYDITIPFNNRRVLELMLSVPLEMRITDEIQKRIIHEFNEEIEKTGIHVQDVSHTDRRAQLERVYLEINTRLPF